MTEFKVKLMMDGKIYTAKRFKDLTEEEISFNTEYPDLWDGDEIFIYVGVKPQMSYMLYGEVEIIKESV